jgi:hypothetical protein
MSAFYVCLIGAQKPAAIVSASAEIICMGVRRRSFYTEKQQCGLILRKKSGDWLMQ